MTERRNGLPPTRALAEPDEGGRMRHLATTFSDTGLAETDVENVLEMNWQAVQTIIRDAIVRVEFEADLTPETIERTLRLAAFALRKLEHEWKGVNEKMRNAVEPGFIAKLIAMTPTEIGKKVRDIIRSQIETKRIAGELGEVREMIFGLRQELAGIVDKKLDGKLLSTNKEFATLYSERQEATEKLLQTDTILELASASSGKSYTVDDFVNGHLHFYKSNNLQPEVIKDLWAERTYRSMMPGLSQFKLRLESSIEKLDALLSAMRDEEKRKIYAESEKKEDE